MKGFKKDGKFRPTERYAKNSLKKKDLYKKSISSPSGSGHEMREKKSMEQGIEIIGISFYDGMNDGGKFRIGRGATVDYKGGWEGNLKGFGSKKLSSKEIKELAKQMDGTDIESEQDEYDWLNEKQTNNTYNGSSAIYPDINFGFFQSNDDRIFMSFKEHGGTGDIRGGYGDNMLFDITDIDTGATGEPEGDLVPFMYPTLNVNVKINGKKYYYDVDGGMQGITETYEVDDKGNEKSIDENEFETLVENADKDDKWALDSAIDKYTEKYTEWQ